MLYAKKERKIIKRQQVYKTVRQKLNVCIIWFCHLSIDTFVMDIVRNSKIICVLTPKSNFLWFVSWVCVLCMLNLKPKGSCLKLCIRYKIINMLSCHIKVKPFHVVGSGKIY